MSLNKFTNTSTGFDLQLDIGCDEIRANNVITDNIDTTTINGLPPGGGSGVTNPLTSDLKLGGFAIIEPLTAISPALNIDQLDPAKKIDLKVGGVAKVVVKNAEVELKTDLNLNQNNINNCLVINNQAGPLNLIGSSNVSAVILDATPTQGVIIGSNVGASTDITGDTSLSLRSNAGSIDLFPSSVMGVVIGGLPRFAVDASETNIGNSLNLNNNNQENANTITASNNLALNAANNTGIIIENAPNDTIIFQKSTNHNNNVLDNVGTGVINTLFTQSINGLTPVGGLYAGTSAGILLNTTALSTLTPATSVGTLTVPANGFSVGDSFHLVVAGDCDLFNNDTVQITLRYDGTTLAQSTVFAVEAANGSNNVFEIEADFTIRSTGATGSVHTSGEFTYNKDSVDSKDFRGIRFNDTQVIDTTTSATLDVLFQFVTRPGASTLQTQLFRLNKVF